MAQPRNNFNLLSLPEEVILLILQKLGSDKIHNEVSRTCKRLQHVVQSYFHDSPAFPFNGTLSERKAYLLKYKPNVKTVTLKLCHKTCVTIVMEGCCTNISLDCIHPEELPSILDLVPTVRHISDAGDHEGEPLFSCLIRKRHIRSISVDYFGPSWQKTVANLKNVRALKFNDFYCSEYIFLLREESVPKFDHVTSLSIPKCDLGWISSRFAWLKVLTIGEWINAQSLHDLFACLRKISKSLPFLESIAIRFNYKRLTWSIYSYYKYVDQNDEELMRTPRADTSRPSLVPGGPEVFPNLKSFDIKLKIQHELNIQWFLTDILKWSAFAHGKWKVFDATEMVCRKPVHFEYLSFRSGDINDTFDPGRDFQFIPTPYVKDDGPHNQDHEKRQCQFCICF